MQTSLRHRRSRVALGLQSSDSSSFAESAQKAGRREDEGRCGGISDGLVPNSSLRRTIIDLANPFERCHAFPALYCHASTSIPAGTRARSLGSGRSCRLLAR